MASTRERKKVIILALTGLGGIATTRKIAEKTHMNVNGVAQTLGVLSPDVECLGGRGGETEWKLRSFQNGWICGGCREPITNEAERSDHLCQNCREPLKKR